MYNEKIPELDSLLKEDNDYRDGRTFSSFNTMPDELAVKIFSENLYRNLGDPALFPGTHKIEREAVSILGNLLNQPSDGYGNIISGGSEANITALWSLRNSFQKKNSAFTHDLEIIAPETIHVSVDKAADLLNVKLRKIKVDSNFQMDIGELESTISDKTMAVAAIAGTTILGTVDPIEEIGRICDDRNIPIHVDAAFGGLVLPFMPYNDLFDFRVNAVKTITVDIHKMGRAPIPGGGILWKNKDLLKRISFTLPYLSKESQKHNTISGSRNGASAIAFVALWKKLGGYQGYKKIVDNCLANTKLLSKGLKELSFVIPVKPVMNIVGVKTTTDMNLSVTELTRSLWDRGWKTTVVKNFLRLVVLPPTKREHIKSFLEEIERIINTKSS